MQLSKIQQPTPHKVFIDDENENEEEDINLDLEDEHARGPINIPSSAWQKDGIYKQPDKTLNSYDRLLSLNESELSQLLHNPKAKEEMIKELMKETLLEPPKLARRSISRPRTNSRKKQLILRSDKEIEQEFEKLAERLKLKPGDEVVKAAAPRHVSVKKFTERMGKCAEAAKTRKEVVAGEDLKEKLKECTFTPKVAHSSERRGISKFLDDQERFNEKVKTDVVNLTAEIREKEKATCQEQPKIGEKSRILARKKEEKVKAKGITTTVHERLYSTRLAESSRKKAEKEEEDSRHNKGNPERIMQLYEEAKTREQTRTQKKEAREQRPKQGCSHVSDPYVIAKFEREFEGCLEAANLPTEGNCWLDLNQMTSLMSGLGFLKSDTAEAAQSAAMVSQIFATLDPKGLGKIPSVNLRTFVAAILNIAVSPPDVQILPPDEHDPQFLSLSTPFPVGEFRSSGVLYMSQEDIERAHSAFQLLYRTRKAYHNTTLKPTYPTTIAREEESAVPRGKGLGRRHSSFVELADSLIQSRVQQMNKIGKMQYEKEAAEKRDCTFVPQILSYTPKTKRTSMERKTKNDLFSVYNKSPAAEKCQELYLMARKSRRAKDKGAVPSKEKGIEECTFTPDLTKNERMVRTAESDDPMIEKSVERMRKGRAERERARKMLERSAEGESMRLELNRNKHSNGTFAQFHGGLVKNSIDKTRQVQGGAKRLGGHRRVATMVQPQPQVNEEKGGGAIKPGPEPRSMPKRVILNIEVNMGERMERIVVREGDTPAHLAYEFSQSHYLDSDARATLELMIGAQIAKALEKIKEEDEEREAGSKCE